MLHRPIGALLTGIFTLGSVAHAVPDVPELLAPADGAVVGPDVVLEARVVDSEGQPLEVGVYLRPRLEGLEPFRVVVLPDTQFYTEADVVAQYGDILGMQVGWILDEAAASNTVFVSHVGDMVQTHDVESQWQVADAAMSRLEGLLPYAVAWGNHDIPSSAADPGWEDLLLDATFPASRFEPYPWWGGGLPDGKTWHSWQTVSAGGLELLFVHLMFEPQEAERAWAAEIIREHPDHFVILTTHSFLQADTGWIDHGSFRGQDLWDEVVAPFDNVRLVLNGHFPGEAHRSDDLAGQPVHQILSCFHGDGNYGSGFLRVLDFDPEAGTLAVSTYSPSMDAWQLDADSEFVLPLPVASLAWWEVHPDVASGGSVLSPWPDARGGTWEWWVQAKDAQGNVASSAIHGFTVEEPSDSDEPLDSDEPDSGEPDSPSDSGAPCDDCADECGCAAGPGPIGISGLLLVLVITVRRRRG